MSEILDVVNENDEVIGQAERDEVHRIGLVCRLAYVCFYTVDGEVILQKRSDTKKNDAGRLTTTVSGHVASGQGYLEAAVRETLEESGVNVEASDLMSLGVMRADYVQGSYLSNAMRGLFAYKYSGSASDLKVEDGDGAGFVMLPIEELERQLDTEPEKFAIVLTDKVGRDLVQGIKKLLDN
ncbi:MAG: NUDIX domain-containing protein [Candidatus Saccharimonadales bacterium]